MSEHPAKPRGGIVLAVIAFALLLGALAWWLHARKDSPVSEADVAAADPASASSAAMTGPGHGRPPLASAEPQATAEAADPRDVRCHQDRRAQLMLLVDGIDTTASPDNAITHALLTQVLQWSEGSPWSDIESAARRWPDNVDIAWLAYNGCHAQAGCDRQAALQHLQRVDGDNAFAWLPAMADAHRDRDEQAFAMALRRAATAPIYDPRMGNSFLRLRPALTSRPIPDSCATSPGLRDTASHLGRPADKTLMADMEANAIEAAFAMPGFQGLSGCRREETPLDEAIVEDCRTLLVRMADGDTLLEQSIALSHLIGLSANDTAGRAWRERYRRLQWLLAMAPQAERIDGYLWRIRAEGEVNVLRQHAQDSGRWPPPRDWLPEGERARELILGGNARR